MISNKKLPSILAGMSTLSVVGIIVCEEYATPAFYYLMLLPLFGYVLAFGSFVDSCLKKSSMSSKRLVMARVGLVLFCLFVWGMAKFEVERFYRHYFLTQGTENSTHKRP